MDITVARTGMSGLAAPIKAGLAMIAGADAALIRLCRRGDDEAWQTLVRNYQDAVYQVSYRLLGNRDDAFEAGQETFVAAFRSIKSFRGDSTFKTWLTTIATRESLKIISKRRLWDELDHDMAASPDSAAASAVHADLEEAVKTVLLNLSPGLRATVVLREFEGLSYEEIAATLRISIGTVESRLHRARAYLRRALIDYIEVE